MNEPNILSIHQQKRREKGGRGRDYAIPTESSTKKKMESITSKQMILFDLVQAMLILQCPGMIDDADGNSAGRKAFFKASRFGDHDS